MLVFTPVIRGQSMTAGTEKLQVSQPVVIINTVGMVKLQGNVLIPPLRKATTLTYSGFDAFFEQALFQTMRKIIRRVLHHYFGQSSLAPKTAIPLAHVSSRARKMAGIQFQLGDARVHGFVVAPGRHQPDATQHLPH